MPDLASGLDIFQSFYNSEYDVVRIIYLHGIRSTMDDIARLDSNIASVEMEGFTVTPETRELLMRCIRKEMTYDEAIDSIIASYVPQT